MAYGKARAEKDDVDFCCDSGFGVSADMHDWRKLRILTEITTGIKLAELLRRPELTYDALAPIDKEREDLSRAVRISAEIRVKYEGYIKRELAEVERSRRLERTLLPDGICYTDIGGLRLEAAEKLTAIRPINLGQASRISGVNPADISVLLIYLTGLNKK